MLRGIWFFGPLVQLNFIKPNARQLRRVWSFDPLVQLNFNKPNAGKPGLLCSNGPMVQLNFIWQSWNLSEWNLSERIFLIIFSAKPNISERFQLGQKVDSERFHSERFHQPITITEHISTKQTSYFSWLPITALLPKVSAWSNLVYYCCHDHGVAVSINTASTNRKDFVPFTESCYTCKFEDFTKWWIIIFSVLMVSIWPS
jgi:hypothetical protein